MKITDQIEFAAWDAYTATAQRDYSDIDQNALRAAIAAVAPLILEEAAKAVEDAGGDNEDYHAAAIRALTPPSHTSNEE